MTSEIVQLSEKLKSRVDTKLILLEYPEPNVVEIVPSGPDTFEISVGLYDEKWLVTSSFWCTVDCGSLENVYSLVCWLLTPYSRIVESWNDQIVVIGALPAFFGVPLNPSYEQLWTIPRLDDPAIRG